MLAVALFVQPKAKERMFALKVQTNILFDYLQTALHGRHQDVSLDSQNKHRASGPKIHFLHKQTPTAHVPRVHVAISLVKKNLFSQ